METLLVSIFKDEKWTNSGYLSVQFAIILEFSIRIRSDWYRTNDCETNA